MKTGSLTPLPVRACRSQGSRWSQALARGARALAAALRGHDDELLVAELSDCQVADDDPVEPRLEGAGWPEVVQRKRDEDGVSGEDLAGELLGEGAGGGLLRGALGRGDELGG